MSDLYEEATSNVTKTQLWLDNLPQTNPTENMMRWMCVYDRPCHRACCYSPDCACIRCDSCHMSLTTPEVQSRYLCVECELCMSEDLNNFCFPVPGLSLCESCFVSDNFKHDHITFCDVNKIGTHNETVRDVGIINKIQILLEDLVVCPRCNLEDDALCQGCLCPFDDSDPPVSAPGCTQGHGIAEYNYLNGVIDSRKFMCRECTLQYLKITGQDYYCDIHTFCKVCSHNEMEKRWREEMKEEARNAANLGYRREELLELHRQKWIQKIILEIFNNSD